MNRATALAKLKKVLGKNMGYREDTKALDAEARDALRPEWEAARAARDALKEQRDARFQAILAGDAEYQLLKAEYKAADDRAAQLAGKLHARRITVGVCSDLFFTVKAEGDNWDEVVKKLTTKEAA